MKVVINARHGGFSLSAKGVARWAELKGRPCYFFAQDVRPPLGFNAPYSSVTQEEAENAFLFLAYDVPNPTVYRHQSPEKSWHDLTEEERKADHNWTVAHQIETRPNDRADPDLVRVVEELGEAAGGKYSKLKVVEIPDGTDYIIEEYDGFEHIAEKHRTWS